MSSTSSKAENGDRMCIYGGDGLYPRTITKELLLSRRHDHTIFENLAEAVIEMDYTGRIIQANRAAQELLAHDLTTLLASRLTDHLAGPECQPGRTMVRSGLGWRFASVSLQL